MNEAYSYKTVDTYQYMPTQPIDFDINNIDKEAELEKLQTALISSTDPIRKDAKKIKIDQFFPMIFTSRKIMPLNDIIDKFLYYNIRKGDTASIAINKAIEEHLENLKCATGALKIKINIITALKDIAIAHEYNINIIKHSPDFADMQYRTAQENNIEFIIAPEQNTITLIKNRIAKLQDMLGILLSIYAKHNNKNILCTVGLKTNGLARANNFIKFLLENSFSTLEISEKINTNEAIETQADKLYGEFIKEHFRTMENGDLYYKGKPIKSDNNYNSFFNRLILFFIQFLNKEVLFDFETADKTEIEKAIENYITDKSNDNSFNEQYNSIKSSL